MEADRKANSTPARVTVLRQYGSEFLRDAMAAGLLEADVQRSVQKVLDENKKLRLDNRMLRDEVSGMKKTLIHYRKIHVDAYSRDIENGRKFRTDGRFLMVTAFAIAGIAVSLTMTVMTIATLF